MISVAAAARSYDVHCRWGALDDLGPLIAATGLRGSAFVVSDDAVAGIFGDRALASLRGAGFDAHLHTFAAGEASKNLDTVSAIYDWLLEHRAERSSPVIALGGGVVGDVAGFAAATYLRGVPFVQAPTSLLAMVDAAIGGKVGVDHPRGKNLIGAFYAPRLVVEDPSTLTSLPPRALREGYAEVIKHGLIMDPDMLDILDARADDLLALEPQLTTEIVARNAALKAKVVSEDERESDRRMILNYGHTIGHAIEAVTAYRQVLHGEAISVGMMAAARIGERLGVTPRAVVERQAALFDRYDLPRTLTGVDPAAVVAATAHDKKVASKRVRWILLEDFGRPIVRDDVPDNVVLGALREVIA
ncbi:MAG TPA: 3-dehydroquinate synthase [Dehalococcoidia bacterium]